MDYSNRIAFPLVLVSWVALGLLFGVRDARAQASGPATPVRTTPSESISLNLKDVPITKVLELFTDQRGLNIVASDAVQGKVTVKLDNVPWEDALAAILRTKGLGYQRSGGIIQVDTLERLNPDLITRVFQLQFLSPTEVREMVQGVLSQTGKLYVLERATGPGAGAAGGGTLVVTDTDVALQRVQSLLTRVDVRPPSERLEIVASGRGRYDVTIRNIPYGRVFDELRRLFQVNIVEDGLIDGRLDLTLTGATQDEAIDSVLTSGNLRYLKEGRTYRVATAQQFKERLVTRLFELQYVDASDVKRFVEPHMTPLGKVEIFTRQARTGFAFGTQNQPRRQATGQGAPQRSDTISVTDTPAVVENISGLIARLDVKPQQVSIEVKIVEVTLTENDTLGIAWNVQASLQGAAKPTGFPFEGMGPANSVLNDTFRFGTISADAFTAVLRALETRNRLKILSSPRISTLNNQEASILIGDKFPITVETIDPQTAVRTVSLDHYEQIGVQLQVVPQISGSDSINLIIHPGVSTVGQLIGDRFPVISTREADTQILVKSGDTAVIGGLIQERLEKNRQNVPGIAKVPVIGELFRSRRDISTKVDLLIFVTPRIVPDDIRPGMPSCNPKEPCPATDAARFPQPMDDLGPIPRAEKNDCNAPRIVSDCGGMIVEEVPGPATAPELPVEAGLVKPSTTVAAQEASAPVAPERPEPAAQQPNRSAFETLPLRQGSEHASQAQAAPQAEPVGGLETAPVVRVAQPEPAPVPVAERIAQLKAKVAGAMPPPPAKPVTALVPMATQLPGPSEEAKLLAKKHPWYLAVVPAPIAEPAPQVASVVPLVAPLLGAPPAPAAGTACPEPAPEGEKVAAFELEANSPPEEAASKPEAKPSPAPASRETPVHAVREQKSAPRARKPMRHKRVKVRPPVGFEYDSKDEATIFGDEKLAAIRGRLEKSRRPAAASADAQKCQSPEHRGIHWAK